MPMIYVFADEAGCLEFSRKSNVSRYFLLCTVTLNDCQVGNDLMSLRRQLAYEGYELGEYFHASADKQVVRDKVFETICSHDFRIDATLLEKSKAITSVRSSRARFYQYGWYYHFKFVAPRIIASDTEMLTTAASLGTRKECVSFYNAVEDVMGQTCHGVKWKTSVFPAATDPCLQVADYCAWAIQRKWESGGSDVRSYDLIKDHIATEYDLWASGTVHYY